MASNPISPADRIRELCAINTEVATMLQSAGHAINALTHRPLEVPNAGENGSSRMVEDGASPTLDEQKQAFTHHTEDYYTGLQSIVARLRRQAYALEEAGIIVPDPSTLALTAQQQQQQQQQQKRQTSANPAAARGQNAHMAIPEAERITNAGLGKLDVGWLNSRGNKVGAEKEGELVEEARRLLEDVLPRESTGG